MGEGRGIYSVAMFHNIPYVSAYGMLFYVCAEFFSR